MIPAVQGECARRQIRTIHSCSGALQDFYEISFAWYGVFSIGICMVVGCVVSGVTHLFCSSNPRCMTPKQSRLYYNCADKCYCYCPENVKQCLRCGIDYSDEKDEKFIHKVCHRQILILQMLNKIWIAEWKAEWCGQYCFWYAWSDFRSNQILNL